MAAPPEVTIKDLSGKWVLNKTLSDDPDQVLALQGVGWLKRKAIGLATVTLSIKQYLDDDKLTHIDIDSTATGGIKGTTELRQLNWTYKNTDDHIFGHLKGRSRWVTIEQVEDKYQKEGWLEGEEEAGGPAGEKHLESYVENEELGWTADQIWGFTVIDGERYYSRRVTVTKGETTLQVRLVYNWVSKLE